MSGNDARKMTRSDSEDEATASDEHSDVMAKDEEDILAFSPDTWSLTYIYMVKFGDVHGSAKCSTIALTAVLYILNFVLQMGMLSGIYFYVVQPLEQSYDVIEKGSYNAALETAVKDNTVNTVAADIKTMCQQQTQTPMTFYLMAVFLWNAKCIGEIGGSIHRLIKTWKTMTRSRSTHPMIQSNIIERLPTGMKIALIILIHLPKIAIAVLVALLGTDFLYTAHCPGNVVIKALALQFIVMIDELLYGAFSTPFLKKRVTKTKLKSELLHTPMLDEWLGGMVRIAATILIMTLVLGLYHSDLFWFRWNCWEADLTHAKGLKEAQALAGTAARQLLMV